MPELTEGQAYEKLQELLALAKELTDSGHYSPDEICDEVRNWVG